MAAGDVCYKLIQFVNDKGKKKSVDFVPVSWIHYDSDLNDICTRFMPPPYSGKRSEELQKIIKCRISPPMDWPKYRVDIRGEARSYEDAVKRLEILKTDNYAFSTDSEEHARAKALADKKSFVKKKINFDINTVESLMEVPPLSHNDSESTIDSSHVSSSSGANSPHNMTAAGKLVAKKAYPMNKDDKSVLNDSSSSNEAVASKFNKKSYKRILQPTEKSIQAKKASKKSNKQPLIDQAAKLDTAAASSAELTDSIDDMISSTSIAKQSTASVDLNSLLSAKVLDAAVTQNSIETVRTSKMSTTTKQSTISAVAADSAKDKKAPKAISKTSTTLSSESQENDMKSLLAKSFLSLSHQQTQIHNAVRELKFNLELFMEKMSINSEEINERQRVAEEQATIFSESSDLNFPLQTVEDFKIFDEKIKIEKFKDQLKREIRCMIDSKSPLTRSITVIIKRFMSRDLVRRFTAVKKVDDKYIFKSTTFASSIQDVVTKEYGRNPKFSPINDKKFNDAIGSIINSAKDWDGKRLLRKKKQQPEHTETNSAADE